MRRLFQVEVPLNATLYVFADSFAAAKALATRSCDGAALELSDRTTGDIAVFGGQYDDPAMPDVSFSPAVSVGEPEIDGLYESDGYDGVTVSINAFHDAHGAAWGVIEQPGMENGDRFTGCLYATYDAAVKAKLADYRPDEIESLTPDVARWDRQEGFWSFDH